MVGPETRNKIAITQPADAFIKNTGIKAQGLDGSSADEQINKLISSINQNKKFQTGQPEFLVVKATKEDIVKAAERALKNSNGHEAMTCFRSLILIAPESKASSDVIDQITGIRIVSIKDGEFRFPTHPTPES